MNQISNLLNYDSPTALRQLLDYFGFGMQKKFGQNFLIDKNIRTELISILNLNKNLTVWEIGPGLGAMTSLILDKDVNLTVFEIDKGFIFLLNQIFNKVNNLKIVAGDVKKTWFNEFKTFGKPNIFFGNLPYNIATDLLLDTIEKNVIFDKILITIQKEVAQKIVASPNTKDYGVLSVLCNWFYDCKIIKIISGSAFWPQPHIQSATVALTSKYNDYFEKPDLFIEIVKALFSSRRKNIKNNLFHWLKSNNYLISVEDLLFAANLSGHERAESLSLYTFCKLYDIIYCEKNEI